MLIADYLQFQEWKNYPGSRKKVLAMGRLAALSIFSAIGFAIGFLGYLSHPTVLALEFTGVLSLLLNPVFIGAFTSGSVGLIASLVLVLRWAKKA